MTDAPIGTPTQLDHPWLLFVTGAPGSGKSSIVEVLLSHAPISIPSGDLLIFDSDWLIETTSELTGQDMTTASALWPAYRRVWLSVLDMVVRNRHSAALFTQSVPTELPSSRWLFRVDSCLLDCDDTTRTSRLQHRGWSPTDIQEALDAATALRRNAAFHIDTTHTSPEGAASQLTSWFAAHA